MFKIVAVIRKKRIDYSYVPEKWEHEGVLYWPQANLSTLRKNPESVPQSDWKQYSCKVKKQHIVGLDEAELWEQQFLDVGTEAENGTIVKKNKNLEKKPNKYFNTDLDDAFTAIDNNHDNHDGNNLSPLIQNLSIKTVASSKVASNYDDANFEKNLKETELCQNGKTKTTRPNRPITSVKNNAKECTKDSKLDDQANFNKFLQSLPTKKVAPSNFYDDTLKESEVCQNGETKNYQPYCRKIVASIDDTEAYYTNTISENIDEASCSSNTSPVEPLVLLNFENNSFNPEGPIISTGGEIELEYIDSPSDTEVINLLKQTFRNETIIMQKLDRLTERFEAEVIQQKATYDKIYYLLKRSEGSATANSKHSWLEKDDDNKMFEDFLKFPLTTVDDVYKFDKELTSNKAYKKYLMALYIPVGGTEGNEEGKVIAKKLRAIFFTEHVLTLFSWTGMSRTSGLKKKEAFQKCEGIKLFLELLSKADNRWSAIKNENFFKSHTLKHANQIMNASEKRIKKKTEKQNIDQNEENNEHEENEANFNNGMYDDGKTTELETD